MLDGQEEMELQCHEYQVLAQFKIHSGRFSLDPRSTL